MSAFLLFYRYLIGEDVTPQLEQYQALGANVLRVFLMVGWDNLSPRFFPNDFPDYWQRLDEFLTVCALREIRVELTIFADAQIVMPREGDQVAFVAQVSQRVSGFWNVFLETCNEPFKNGVDVTRVVPPSDGYLRASGKYDLPDNTIGAPGPNLHLFRLDYVTIHTERKDEWPRTAKDLQEYRDGYNGDGRTFRGLDPCDCPCVGDEPMGADEVDKPGSRSNVPDDFRYYAATAALMGAGATFHSTDGLNAALLRPVQYACAWEFFTAFLFVPPAAQIAPYQRGSEFGGPGVGNMPMEHVDVKALRTFCKQVDGVEYCVAIRPTADWQAVGRDGWRVVEEPARGLVKLQR
jgi:hypothetical protein